MLTLFVWQRVVTHAREPSPTLLTLSPETEIVEKGTTTDILIELESTAPLVRVDMILTFDPEKLELFEVNPGPFLTKAGLTAVWSAPVIDSEKGTLSQTVHTLEKNSPGASISGELVTLRFYGKSEGVSELSLKALDKTAAGKLIVLPSISEVPPELSPSAPIPHTGDHFIEEAVAEPTAEIVAGDLNADGIVNSIDATLLENVWFESGEGDLNGDGIINSLDYIELSRRL